MIKYIPLLLLLTGCLSHYKVNQLPDNEQYRQYYFEHPRTRR